MSTFKDSLNGVSSTASSVERVCSSALMGGSFIRSERLVRWTGRTRAPSGGKSCAPLMGKVRLSKMRRDGLDVNQGDEVGKIGREKRVKGLEPSTFCMASRRSTN